MNKDNQIIQDISEMKGEMKYISKTLQKMEKVIENQVAFNEKQSFANKRILSLEKNHEKNSDKITNLEKWQTRVIAIATVIATIAGFLLNKIF